MNTNPFHFIMKKSPYSPSWMWQAAWTPSPFSNWLIWKIFKIQVDIYTFKFCASFESWILCSLLTANAMAPSTIAHDSYLSQLNSVVKNQKPKSSYPASNTVSKTSLVVVFITKSNSRLEHNLSRANYAALKKFWQRLKTTVLFNT